MYFNIKNILNNHGFVNKNAYNNIYIKLYESLKKAILNRDLNQNTKLPPSRVLAKDLKISRSTVVKAYELLVIEKYVQSVPGSGHFVNLRESKKIHHYINTSKIVGGYPSISKKGVSFQKNLQIINTLNTKTGVAFRPGLPPLDIFPVSQWKNLTNNYWRNIKSSELSYSNTIGLKRLRENIANYLKIYRNIDIDANQLIITTGSLHSLFLIGTAMIDNKDNVVIENPTYPHAIRLFKSLEAEICAANIDSEGMSVKNITCQKPKLIYTTPSNQYPTGVKMSLNRRLELLKWSSNKNTLIIEDDYDHEFSNWENPISSIFSLDNQERVIYLGTFNKLLHPSIRLGYMIVPKYLMTTITAIYEQSNRFVTHSLQKILSVFIEKDYLNKHLRNVIEVSIQRKKIFTNCFNSQFENEISIDSNNIGLHVIGNIKNKLNDIELTNYLKNKGVIAHPFSSYFIGNIKENGLIMGYCSVNNKLIKENIIKMKKAYLEYVS